MFGSFIVATVTDSMKVGGIRGGRTGRETVMEQSELIKYVRTTTMNRRNFLAGIINAGAAFAILPAATTYIRTWSGVLVPDNRWQVEFMTEDGVIHKVVYRVIHDLKTGGIVICDTHNDPATQYEIIRQWKIV